jgi:hypothetical protein
MPPALKQQQNSSGISMQSDLDPAGFQVHDADLKAKRNPLYEPLPEPQWVEINGEKSHPGHSTPVQMVPEAPPTPAPPSLAPCSCLRVISPLFTLSASRRSEQI